LSTLAPSPFALERRGGASRTASDTDKLYSLNTNPAIGGDGEFDQDLLLFHGPRLTVWNGGGFLVDSGIATSK
jgi:hypothetical protein